MFIFFVSPLHILRNSKVIVRYVLLIILSFINILFHLKEPCVVSYLSMDAKVMAQESVVIEVEGFHEHGYCKSGAANLYYALFGRGPVKVVLLMGM